MELTRNQFTIPRKFKKETSGPEIQQADQKSNSGPEIQRTKERDMAEQIPYKYSGNKNSTTIPQITIKCKDADGNENQEECPIFTNGTHNEVLIQTIETIIVLGDRYDWKESGVGKEKLYYQNFGRALKGEPSKKWEGLIQTIRTKTVDNFKTKVVELVEEIMGEDVYKDQLKYLVDTPQPANFTTAEWCDRVAVINAGLIWLKKGAKAMTEEEVIEKVISVNLKPDLMRDFILEKGDKATTLKEVKQILRRIDRANAHMKQATERLNKSKGKETNKKVNEKESVNMCRLKDHDHHWQDCPNNPVSKNFSGKSYTEIPASERYENDFAKKAERMAKEEKEAKKKASVKKEGDLHVIQRKPGTPMVTIQEKKGKYKELEYDSDDDSGED